MLNPWDSGLLVIIFLLAIILIWLTLIYRRLIRESLQITQREKTLKSLEDLNSKAIAESQLTAKKILEQFESSLAQISQTESQLFKTVLADLAKVAGGKLDENLVALSRETQAKFLAFLEDVEKQTRAEAQIQTAKIYHDYAKDLEERKRRRLQEFEADILAVVKKTTRSVLGEMLDTQKQEELVAKALKSAKDELKS